MNSQSFSPQTAVATLEGLWRTAEDNRLAYKHKSGFATRTPNGATRLARLVAMSRKAHCIGSLHCKFDSMLKEDHHFVAQVLFSLPFVEPS